MNENRAVAGARSLGALLIVGLLSIPAGAQDTQRQWVSVKSGPVAVTLDPKPASVVVGLVTPGIPLEVREIRGEWYWVVLPKDEGEPAARSGWIHAAMVVHVPAPAVVAAAAPEIAPPKAQPPAHPVEGAERGPKKPVPTADSRSSSASHGPAVPREGRGSVRLRGFATTGMSWALATASFDAVGLASEQMESGAGAHASGLWRNLFAEVNITRWSSAGERAFVDSTGTRFPLGIPLEVSAINVDLTAGWEFDGPAGGPTRRFVPYVGGGAGVVMYTEQSPFAGSGDDVDDRHTSYHVAGGVEVRVVRWFAVAADVRHRRVSGLLGVDGVSKALGEDRFGGTTVSGRFLVGF